MNKELLTKFNIKRKYTRDRIGVRRHRSIDTLLVWRVRARKAEVHLKFSLARDIKVKKKDFHTGISATKGRLRKIWTHC